MNKGIYKYTFIAPLLLLFGSCKKPYTPAVITSGTNYLVVEGSINTGADSTIIHLTHTIPLSSPSGTVSPPELNATVTVESDANATYPLSEIGNGYYASAGLNLSSANKYKLKIITTGNKIYESDFVPVKNSPPIDSVSYQVETTDLRINVSTHDASNNTRYYRWDYDETWIIHSKYDSQLKLITYPVDSIVLRPASEQIYTCWQSQVSSDIVLGSTAKITNDILTNYPVTVIPSTSEKLAERYSILVKQYAMTPDAFNYYQELRKNTESLGTIFDPQPSSLTGNIHCTTNPSEQVIGYITAGSVSKVRIFVDARNLPANANWIPSQPQFDCDFEETVYNPDPLGVHPYSVKEYLYTGILIPIQPLQLPGAAHPIGYTGASPICVDCTLRGVNKPPAFWTNE
ncbi:MAG: DUF4249 domain-containing protein [Bacteroidetes bacterium]|jgi:hypothetical protein|nr:DUF4249 domain-containing protein [Bacteroidota bacterium]